MPEQETETIPPEATVESEPELSERRGRKPASAERSVKVTVKQEEIVPAGEQSQLVKGPGRSAQDPHESVVPSNRNKAKWLDENCQKDEYEGWSITVIRTVPSHWERVSLDLKKPLILNAPLRSFDSIRSDIVETFGGGEFRILIRDRTGSGTQGTINFKIPTEQYPVLLTDAERSGGASAFTGSGEMPDGSVGAPEQTKEVQEAKTRLAKMDVESQIKQKERDEREKDESYRDHRENKGMAPLRAELDAKLERLQSEVKNVQVSSDAKFDRLIDKLDAGLRPKEESNSIEKMMAAMSTMMAPLMAVLGKRDENQGNKEVEAIKAQGELMKQHVQMQMEMNKTAAEKAEKLNDKYFAVMTQAAKPENPKKAIIESMELIKMIREEMTPEAEAPPVQYNPEMSPVENMISGIATWLQRKNAQAPPPPQYPQQLNPPPAQAPHGLETFELETPNIPMPPPARPAPALPPAVDTPEARLRFTVTESMRTALKEARESALAATWPQDAHATWAPTFQDQLASAPHDGARMDLIKAQCDPRIWTELELYLTSKQQIYRVFMSGLRELVAQVVEVKAPAAGGTI